MGRIRTIKPEFHAHEELSSLPAETHLLAAALMNYSDDYGYFNANPVLVKAGTNPLRDDGTKIEDQLADLERIGFIEIRAVDKKRIGKVLHFQEHQRVSHPTPSKLQPLFEGLQKSSGNIPESLPNVSSLKGKEQGTGNREQGSDPPVLSTDVAARVLSEKVGNLNIRFQEQLERTIRASLHSGESLEACVDRMAGQWQRYNLARDQLNYPVQSAQKFFESGTWHDEKLWPWKEATSELESYRRSTLGVGA